MSVRFFWFRNFMTGQQLPGADRLPWQQDPPRPVRQGGGRGGRHSRSGEGQVRHGQGGGKDEVPG